MFDSKIFNPQVFGEYLERIPNLKRNELLNSGVIRNRPDLARLLPDQTGGNYITVPMRGLLDGEPVNYDGNTDITSTTTDTYKQSMVVSGWAKGWTESDFSYDITGVDFMDNVAKQIATYDSKIEQDKLLAILNGIFAMTGAGNLKFVTNHTHDISADADNNKFDAITLNNAIQRACGDNKNIFKVVIMHSQVATNLENLQLLEYSKQTDSSGITRNLALGTLNGKILLIDDSMPLSVDGVYTTYVLGDGAFDYSDCGAKVPYEMQRDPKTKGGQDTLYIRRRKLYAPRGISFTQSSMATLSPTVAELVKGENWELVHNGQTLKGYIDHKAIPIVRILSKG